MRKKRFRLVILLVLSIIIILAVIIWASLGTQPTQRVAGVKVGDVFTYELEGLWEPTDQNATLSDIIPLLNMTEYYRVTITNVSYPEILIRTLWQFKNGTEIEGEGKVDMETGIYSGGFYMIYAANLKAGEYTHPVGFDKVTINSTVTREYPAGTRETNRLILTAQFYNISDPSQVYNDYRTLQFDKQTGMMVEFRNQNIYNNPKKTETIVWKLKDSNVWTVT